LNIPIFGRIANAGWHHMRLVQAVITGLDQLEKSGQCLGAGGESRAAAAAAAAAGHHQHQHSSVVAGAGGEPVIGVPVGKKAI
jgi:hypothetical protein